jgi:hypothetical protein
MDRWAGVAGLLVLVACGPSPGPAEAPWRPGDWREFEGSWNATGTRHALTLGGERRAALLDLRGSLVLAGPARPGLGFRGEAIALVDSAKGLTGHAVWTDERGDQVFSELRGEGSAARHRIEGTFIGGTGRYAGATGSYAFAWQYVVETEDGTFQGRTVGLKGRVRAGSPALPASPASGGRP